MFEEDSVELLRIEELGLAIRPAIAKLPEWSRLREVIVHAKSAGASRGHVYVRSDASPALIERLQKVHVSCSNPECVLRFPAIRLHRNGTRWSIHVSGIETNGHGACRHRKETKLQTEWLYLVTKQAVRGPRLAKAIKNSDQGLFKINAKNELEYL